MKKKKNCLATIIAGLSHQLLKVTQVRMCQAQTHIYTANKQMCTNIHGNHTNAHTLHTHTQARGHTARQHKGSDTYTEAHTHNIMFLNT